MPALLVLSAAVAVAFLRDIRWAAAALPAAFAINVAAWRSVARSLWALLPIALFALALALLQWLFGAPDPLVAAKTLVVFWLTTAACRWVPWTELGGAIRPGSRLSAFVLYLLFVRHFTSILAVEAGRLLHARARAVPKSPRPLGLPFPGRRAGFLVSPGRHPCRALLCGPAIERAGGVKTVLEAKGLHFSYDHGHASPAGYRFSRFGR